MQTQDNVCAFNAVQHTAMTQWPPHLDHGKLAVLARAWLSTMPAAEIVPLCAIGLQPKTTANFTVFWCRGKVTALTCTPDDSPGTSLIQPHRLTSLALLCLWLGMHPLSMASFCRRGVVQHSASSPFWAEVSKMLSFAVAPSIAVYSAALGGTPWRREFVEAAGARMHARGSSLSIDAFLELALSQPWVCTHAVAWPAAVCRWITEYKLEYAVQKSTSATACNVFSIYGFHIQLVRRRDAIFVLLMCLFADKSLGWGERVPRSSELPIPVAHAFLQHPFLHQPQTAAIHRLLASTTG